MVLKKINYRIFNLKKINYFRFFKIYVFKSLAKLFYHN